jgi:MFS family permease
MGGSIIGAPIAGWIFDNWGSYQGAWFVFAGLSTISVVLIAATRPAASSAQLADKE